MAGALEKPCGEEPQCKGTPKKDRRLAAREAFDVGDEIADRARANIARQALDLVRGLIGIRGERTPFVAMSLAKLLPCFAKRRCHIADARGGFVLLALELRVELIFRLADDLFRGDVPCPVEIGWRRSWDYAASLDSSIGSGLSVAS